MGAWNAPNKSPQAWTFLVHKKEQEKFRPDEIKEKKRNKKQNQNFWNLMQ